MKEAACKILALNFMGCLWGYGGMNLIRKGLSVLFLNASWQWAVLFTLLAVVIGFFKARTVLRKTAQRLLTRLPLVNSYSTIFKLFDLKLFILIPIMVGFAIGLNLLPGFESAKAIIKTAIGYGLLQSSFYFFKPAFIYGIRG